MIIIEQLVNVRSRCRYNSECSEKVLIRIGHAYEYIQSFSTIRYRLHDNSKLEQTLPLFRIGVRSVLKPTGQVRRYIKARLDTHTDIIDDDHPPFPKDITFPLELSSTSGYESKHSLRRNR